MSGSAAALSVEPLLRANAESLIQGSESESKNIRVKSLDGNKFRV